MDIVSSDYKYCPCCETEHLVQTIKRKVRNVYYGYEFTYDQYWYYCVNKNKSYQPASLHMENLERRSKAYSIVRRNVKRKKEAAPQTETETEA